MAQVGRTKFFPFHGAATRIGAPQRPGIPQKTNFFELFLNRLLTLKRPWSYTPPIDGVAAHTANAVRDLLETSRVYQTLISSDQSEAGSTAKVVRRCRPSLRKPSGFHQDALFDN